MAITLKLLPAMLALATAACVHSSNGGVAATSAVLTPTQLIATAKAHLGQTATVVGYFTWRTDTRALWQDRGAYLDVQQQRKGANFDYWAKCVTVYQTSASARALSDRPVRISGKVTILGDEDMRSLWACNRVAIEDAVISPA